MTTYHSAKLMTRSESTLAERIELRLYLQRCIFEFWRVKGRMSEGMEEADRYFAKRNLANEIEHPGNRDE